MTEIPKVTDWEVVTHGDHVYVESHTISHELEHYDDAWLGVVGNMSFEEKTTLAETVARRLNSAGRLMKRIEDLEIECKTLQHGCRLYTDRILELEEQLHAARGAVYETNRKDRNE